MNKSFPIVSLVLTLSSFSALAADTHCHVKAIQNEGTLPTTIS
ncbi:hypothetical protein [Photobacterium phosphoreum]|nr:hypothetical protein [Photobacterium phosphoreum]